MIVFMYWLNFGQTIKMPNSYKTNFLTNNIYISTIINNQSFINMNLRLLK